jgi:hypothetical protein
MSTAAAAAHAASAEPGDCLATGGDHDRPQGSGAGAEADYLGVGSVVLKLELNREPCGR